MELNLKSITENSIEWEEKGYVLPKFDIKQVTENTKKNPVWVHFGAGNIFRAFQANLMQRLLDAGITDTGIVAVDGFDYEIISKNYRPHDNLSIAVTLKSDGNIEKKVIASIAETCILDSENEIEYNRLKEIFRCPALQTATFTITEKGYAICDAKGDVMPFVKYDFDNGITAPKSYMGKVTSLLYERYLCGAYPIAMVSNDNCARNGEKLFDAVIAYAAKWEEKGFVKKGFTDYLSDPKKVSFPWTMIDKITPRPDKDVEKILEKDGLNLTPVITSKNTYVAPFVNAEESEYLVVEDMFPNGRPAFEKAGVIFTDREKVTRVERMKVCTCLNPLHTALAVFGCLLGFTKISDEMKDPGLVRLIKEIGYKEGLPVVTDPGIISPKEFIDTVVNIRIPNPFMPDTPQRIATDTSQKLSVRFGETIKAYQKSDTLSVKDLKKIPLVFAGWLRYLFGVNDNGDTFELSPDPMIPELKKYINEFKLFDMPDFDTTIKILSPILKNKNIFGVDLFEVGMAEDVTKMFIRMSSEKGAVRREIEL